MILAIWNSFRRLPLWVQLWMVLLLMPANLISLFFLRERMGVLIAVLAIGGMIPNLLIVMYDRGMSKLMSLPHVVAWTPLCVLLLWMLFGKLTGRLELERAYTLFLFILLAVDAFSLVFDFLDTWKWYQGDRGIA